LVEAPRALFESGRVSKADVSSAEINQANDMARLAEAKANRELAQNELREVLGLPIDTEVDGTDTTIPFDPIQIELDSWIRQAVERRPELVRAKTEIKKEELAVRVRKNEVLPSFYVGGGFESVFDGASWNWNVRGELRYPIGNVAARSRLEQATTDRSRLNAKYARLKR
jgi:outer membrane protein TolC